MFFWGCIRHAVFRIEFYGIMSDKECSDSGHEKPTVLLVIGMAGSGKTSLIHRIQTHIEENEKEGYILNLDPAVLKVPYEPNVDIRDTVRLGALACSNCSSD
jgi:GTPase SAR1 family protein